MDFKTSRASKKMGNTPYHTSAASQHRDKSCCEDFDWPLFGQLAASVDDNTWYGQLTSVSDRDWNTSFGTGSHPVAANFLAYSSFFTPKKLVATSFKLGTRKQNDSSTDTDTTLNIGISCYTIPFDSVTGSGTQSGKYSSSNITVPNDSEHYLTNLDDEISGVVIPANSYVMIGVKSAATDALIYFHGNLTFKKS